MSVVSENAAEGLVFDCGLSLRCEPVWTTLMLAAAVLTALAWTTLPRSEHPSGVPERTDSPQAAFSLAKRDGAAILTGVEVTAAGVGAASLQVVGEELLAVQAPIHVGVNNFGFKADHRSHTTPIVTPSDDT